MAEISYPADWRDIAPEKWSKMLLTPELYSAMRAERLAREAAAPAERDLAPDFTSERLLGQGKRTGEMFGPSHHFSQNGGRPVGLVFGSYT